MNDVLLEALGSLRAKAVTDAERRLLQLLPPSILSREKRAERDAAVRGVLDLLPGSPTAKACDLQRHLGRYLDSAAWQADAARGAGADVPELRRRIAALAQANEGRALRWRQVMRIAAEADPVTETASDDRTALG